MGRPTALTDDVADLIGETLAAGSTWRDAAAAAGLHEATIRRWRAQGQADEDNDHDTPFRALCAALRVREAEATVRMVTQLVEASLTDWRAAAWWLERNRPEAYGRRVVVQRVEHVEATGALEDVRTRLLAKVAAYVGAS